MTKRFLEKPQKWDETTDVLIIGSGFAGLSAAYESASAGAATLILEKMSYLGGNSALAGGGYASSDSRLKLKEKLGTGKDSWQLHMDDTIRGGNNYSFPELVEIVAKNAPGGLDFLLDAGVTFKEILVKSGCHSAPRCYMAKSTGKEMVNALTQVALNAGAQIRANTKVTGIFRDGPEGSVLGVEVSGENGAYTIQARGAVLIASGGFGQDVDLRMKYSPALGPQTPCSNHTGATGEVIGYAREIGADTLHMAFVQFFPCANPDTGSVDEWALASYSSAGFGGIYVDQSGKRFVNELAGRDAISNAQMDSCKKPTFAIINEKIARAMLVSDNDINTGIRLGRMIRAETIAELEQKLGIPPGNLTATIQRFNTSLELGNDPEFGVPVDNTMIPLSIGPFFAITQWPSIHFTMGGLRFDGDARVLDISGKPIPGLFAAGEVCGGVHGANRLGGNALAECIVFGRIAGINAAKHL